MELETEPLQELLTSREVAVLLAVSRRTLWRMVARGEVPEPIRYNRKLVRWKSSDIARYLDSLS